MNLFKFEDYRLVMSEEALAIRAFSNIWNRDKSKHKEVAIQELGYIYFMYDPRSDYMYLTNEVERSMEVKEHEGLDAYWRPDDVMLEAIEVYKQLTTTTSSLLLEDTRFAVDRLRIALRNIDLDEKDDKGKPIYTMNVITSTIKQIPGLIKDLSDAEKQLAKDIADNSRMKGQGAKKLFEDEIK